MQPQIRAECPADYDAIARVHTAAFGQPNEAQLVHRIRQSDRYIPELTFVALQARKIVGHLMISQIDLQDETALPVLALAPLAVLPEYQRQGMGKRLMQIALSVASQHDELLIVVLGHPRFYASFGFEVAEHYGITAPFPVPREAFRVKWLRDPVPVSGKIIYPPAFEEV